MTVGFMVVGSLPIDSRNSKQRTSDRMEGVPTKGRSSGGRSLTREATREHPNQMPMPPKLAPLNMDEQLFHSEPLPDSQASNPVSKGGPRHPAEETCFDRLHLQSRSIALP
ncbi:uncharacterized protein ACNS7B_015724 [Menidia menidia]